MMKNNIIAYLDKIIVNPKCELDYNKDYELLIATMLSAQTTDKRVNIVTKELFSKYPNLKSLKMAPVDDVKKIIKSLGNYNKKAVNVIGIAKILDEECSGVVPNNRVKLESMPGVGRKTANVVLANLFNEDVIAVDTHINRVSKRLGLALPNDSVLTVEEKLTKKFKNYNLGRVHHQLLLFGRYYCTAINPKCSNCELKKVCKKDISKIN